MSKESSSSSSGIGFAGALTIAFIVLKLTNVIDWSWWWVLSPSLISIGIVLIVLAVVGLVYLWSELREGKQEKKETQAKSRFQTKLDEEMAKQKAERN